ncbi:MAG: helix-turn-helix transcriptional regulator [Bilophila wadsworthia]|uniref:helix-turn-helix transcriptional regulator n=1 Tax=Bilophila wadsworthia TaxID=35833 RepID=UPI0027B8A883|nr:helix-turn-helix transcriptional regulator [Bilophila wadsworthia]
MGIDFFAHHEEKMRDNPEYKAAYDALEQEFAIANALIQARSEAGMTQKDVAEKLGVSQPAVARMESGKNISIKAIARYAKAVGRPINLSILPV